MLIRSLVLLGGGLRRVGSRAKPKKTVSKKKAASTAPKKGANLKAMQEFDAVIRAARLERQKQINLAIQNSIKPTKESNSLGRRKFYEKNRKKAAKEIQEIEKKIRKIAPPSFVRRSIPVVGKKEALKAINAADQEVQEAESNNGFYAMLDSLKAKRAAKIQELLARHQQHPDAPSTDPSTTAKAGVSTKGKKKPENDFFTYLETLKEEREAKVQQLLASHLKNEKEDEESAADESPAEAVIAPQADDAGEDGAASEFSALVEELKAEREKKVRQLLETHAPLMEAEPQEEVIPPPSVEPLERENVFSFEDVREPTEKKVTLPKRDTKMIKDYGRFVPPTRPIPIQVTIPTTNQLGTGLFRL
ncbi:enterotoxin [Angomonas deanei]|uniref:Uncharacterized protein n=1 Tax=Angomonas deanei TaxID=59799 RepID=A0A7G2CPE6_9TRYP|nr:enterotoxin [Angomonas deanei]CAD2221375.1 hypothetical protein, conserved [Angomonas deanei]|eukprot:EPY22547.1 enterotoxin [Angomonas deanei]